MRLITLTVIGLALFAGQAQAATPKFRDGNYIAKRMKAHYDAEGNNTWRASVRKLGADNFSKTICAYMPKGTVECFGEFAIEGIKIHAWWTLTKITNRKAKLAWTFKGNGVSEQKHTIINPSAYRLLSF